MVVEVGQGEGAGRAVEAGQALLDIGRIADLRHLPVADDVDAGPGLAPDHVGDGVGDSGRHRRRVGLGQVASLPSDHEIGETGRAGRLLVCVVRTRSVTVLLLLRRRQYRWSARASVAASSAAVAVFSRRSATAT